MSSAKFLVSDTPSLKQLPILLAVNLISLWNGFMKSSSLNHKQMYSLRVQCYSCHTTPDLLLLILMNLLTDASDISSSKFHIAQETAICHNPHNSPKWDFRITNQLVYKHTFCQNAVSPKKLLILIFSQKHNILTCWSVENQPIFSVSHKTVYQWSKTNCCFMSHILFLVLTDHNENVNITHLMLM